METLMKIEYTAVGIIIWIFIGARVIVSTIEIEWFKVLPTKESCIELIQNLD